MKKMFFYSFLVIELIVFLILPFYMLYDWSLRDNTRNPERRYIFNIYNTMRCGEDCTYG